jgi:Tfp pilus tip-associated adhesin PilY1
LAGYYWVFWGTGDKANPNINGAQNRFFAVRDDNPSAAYTASDLSGEKGWYIDLFGQERVLSDSMVYKGIVFFTTYTPPGGSDLCGATGGAALYGIAMMPVSIGLKIYNPGEGVFSVSLGTGIPSAPVVSQKPLGGSGKGSDPDVFVGVSGGVIEGAVLPAKTLSSADMPAVVAEALKGSGPSSRIIHWRDRRVQPY